MNEVKKLTFRDRIRDAINAFRGRKIGSIRFGVDLKRCDECEYRQNNLRDNLLVTAGVIAADMDSQGYIILECGIEAEADLALYISKVVDKYLDTESYIMFDEYIEIQLTKQYGTKN